MRLKVKNCNFYYTCNEIEWFFPCWKKFQSGKFQFKNEKNTAVFYNSSNHTLLIEGSSFGDGQETAQILESFYLNLSHAEPTRALVCLYLKASRTKNLSLIIEFISLLSELAYVGHHIDIIWLYSSHADASYCLGETLMEEFPELPMSIRSISKYQENEKSRSRNILEELVADPMFQINMRMTLNPDSKVNPSFISTEDNKAC